MATYLELWSELKTYVPKLDITLAQKLVNRAYKDIRESRFWSFLLAETSIATPASISNGTIIATLGSTFVSGDSTALTAWDAIDTPNHADFISRQFRIAMGPLYNIVDYVSPNLTLDRPYAETSTVGGTYLLYKAYYPEPAANFLRWVSVVDPVDGYRLATNRTKAEIDLRDPLRGAITQPYVISAYKWNAATSQHLFELYPHPTIQRTYPALYQTRGDDFVLDADILPVAIPDEVLIARAKFYAYEWALSNSAIHPELKGVNWQYLQAQTDASYRRDLEKAKKQDEEIFMMNYTESYLLDPFRRFAFDGNYAQSHDVGWVWAR